MHGFQQLLSKSPTSWRSQLIIKQAHLTFIEQLFFGRLLKNETGWRFSFQECNNYNDLD